MRSMRNGTSSGMRSAFCRDRIPSGSRRPGFISARARRGVVLRAAMPASRCSARERGGAHAEIMATFWQARGIRPARGWGVVRQVAVTN
ncbi:hypothetical protein GCM10017596_07810 [Microbacterium keratanolyticum]|uniref:Uncharacterized protein n=1 Tax=Microbacterium keratanolyticum TaxID=67574 RepID=A0A9W6HS25_9MICO|nr:hypothetical protein GCM10017596_07810 [Microbacterium keratanolyticum]